MAGRKRKAEPDPLTGGSGDVSPQVLKAAVTQTANNAYNQIEIPIPVNRVATGSDKTVQIIELLSVAWDISGGNGVTLSQVQWQLTSASRTLINSIAQVDTLAFYNNIHFGGIGFFIPLSGTIPLNDGGGHGILVGSTSLFLGLDTIAMTSVQTVAVAIMYRFKNVGIVEFMSLITQGSTI